MPLSRENRYLLEVAIITHLRIAKEATSLQLYMHLKERGILAVRGTKQVSMICSELEKKGVLLSRKPILSPNLRAEVKKVWRMDIWRLNRNFYKEHPNRSMFTFQFRAPEETSKARKRRIRATR